MTHRSSINHLLRHRKESFVTSRLSALRLQRGMGLARARCGLQVASLRGRTAGARAILVRPLPPLLSVMALRAATALEHAPRLHLAGSRMPA